MRLLCPHFPSFGSLGAQALGLIKDIGRRTNLFVPPALTHESSWASMTITSFLRPAISPSKFVNVFYRIAVCSSPPGSSP